MGLSNSFSGGRPRDPLLDLWRGVALIDMAWVHLATYSIGMPNGPTDWIGQHTRFAAGCFVLLSGMTVRTVFGPGLAAGGDRARQVVRRLLRRALLLAVVGRLTCVAFALLERSALSRSATAGASVGSLDDLMALVTFAEPGATGGLLLLYSFLLCATPGMERLRRRAGNLVLVALSIAVFAAASVAGEAAHWPPWTFPIAHWQPFFVIGYAAAPEIYRLRRADGTIRARWRVLVTAACLVFFVLRSGPAVGIAVASLPVLDFTKVPLTPAEFLWYLVSTSFVLTWTGWLHESSERLRRGALWVRRLGQWSLLIYVAHLLLELPFLAVLTRIDPSPAMRTLTLAAMAAALNGVALMAERLDNWEPSGPTRSGPLEVLRQRLPTAGATGIGVALASLACVLLLRPPLAPTAAVDVGSVPDQAVEEIDAHASAAAEGAGAAPADLHLADSATSTPAGAAALDAPAADDGQYPAQLDPIAQ